MMQNILHLKRLRYRTIWISDVHLGHRSCSADLLLDFLRASECERLYLVGDIIDIHSMRRRIHWPQAHNDVVRAILGKPQHGTQVVYVAGNHDEELRDYAGMVLGNIRIAERAIHETAAGRRLLVLHGDEFDALVRCNSALAAVGSRMYGSLLHVSIWVNIVRRRFGFSHWSLAAAVKSRVKNAMRYMERFEDAAAFEAARLGMDGVVCGHIHRPALKLAHGVTYANCGDWVESCTAMIEHHDGTLELIDWAKTSAGRVGADLAAA